MTKASLCGIIVLGGRNNFFGCFRKECVIGVEIGFAVQCTAVKCIRISRDFKDKASFSIERTCRHRDADCPYEGKRKVDAIPKGK